MGKVTAFAQSPGKRRVSQQGKGGRDYFEKCLPLGQPKGVQAVEIHLFFAE